MHNSEQQPEDYRNHAQVWELLPWYVNGSLPAAQQPEVARHIAVCLLCRKEVRAQGALRDAVRRHELDELMVAASFDRLSAKLRDEEVGVGAAVETGASPPGMAGSRFYSGVKRWLQRQYRPLALLPALSVLLLVVLLPAYLAQRWLENPAFRTLSDSANAAAVTADFRLIFVDGLAEQDRNAIVDGAGLRIVAGPDERGQYFVEAPGAGSAAALAATLEALRSHEQILFAQPAAAMQAP